MNESSRTNLPLGGGSGDAGTALLKGLVGAIPFAGSIFAEALGWAIPNQRLNRIEAYLLALSARLDSIDPEALKVKFEDPETLDLFEEGIVQSVRAVSNERKNYIAQIVANGINGDEKNQIEAKRLLHLLEQIDDDQIIILTSYLHRHRHDEDWRDKHASVLEPVRAHLGSGRDELDAATLYELARSQLHVLGLLRSSFKAPKKGELPEFDSKTGMLKAGSRELTPLGRLLLTRAGLAEEGEL